MNSNTSNDCTSYEVFGPDKKTYKNNSEPRGFVFIANYNEFSEDKYKERRGSDKDVKNLTSLFTQMGYEVKEPKINVNKKNTLDALDEFRDDEDLKNIDSVVVIIMSHGDGDKFIAYDNKKIDSFDVIDKFSNRNCKHLIDKPKIFIFQSCRGPSLDEGVNLNEEFSTDGLDEGATTNTVNLPTYSDIFVIYPTIPIKLARRSGYQSYRSYINGTWLIQALCKEFMENAHCEELNSLIQRVSASINSYASSATSRQSCVFSLWGVTKRFYFNPQPLKQKSRGMIIAGKRIPQKSLPNSI